MDLNLKNKCAIVTGASQGIGREIAISLAKEGCRIISIARREKELEDLTEYIGGLANAHTYIAADLMIPGKAAEISRYLVNMGTQVDIVIHNLGGTLEVRDPLAMSDEWNKVWYFNVGHAIDMNHHLIPPMQQRGWGRVVHVSSITATKLRGCAAYGAAKACLNAYVEVVGRAVAPSGVVMSAVMPGAIYAEGGHWDEKAEKNLKDPVEFARKKADFLRHHQAAGRFGFAREIAPFVTLLASDHASFAQGAILPIDGGTM